MSYKQTVNNKKQKNKAEITIQGAEKPAPTRKQFKGGDEAEEKGDKAHRQRVAGITMT
nr:hypothetical protein [Desulfobulbaceae bacterium]